MIPAKRRKLSSWPVRSMWPYVSRGGLKLEKAIGTFGIRLDGLICMDVGASTGGFTDCMLQNGAVKVYSIDVGHGQLDWKLRNDSRVVCMEKFNARYLTPEDIPDRPSFSSIDVSFISLTKILEPVSGVLSDEGRIAALIKPQFEAGREKVGKKGVVRDAAVHEEVIRKVRDYALEHGLTPNGLRGQRHGQADHRSRKQRAPESGQNRGRGMNGFYVIANQQKDTCRREAEFIRKYLEDHGKKCYIQEQARSAPDSRYRYTDAGAIPPDVEGVLVLGGDGTLIQASRDLAETGLPLLGINMGSLGYLAEIDLQNVPVALDRLMGDDFSIEDRMMIAGTVYHQNRVLMRDMALNDIVIGRRAMRVIDINLFVDDIFLCSYRADGFIVSTPTGSTGYSLSAGGPIVEPEASLMLLTAVAPHTLTSRSIVLPDNVAVTVEVTKGKAEDREKPAEAMFDGDTSVALTPGSRVVVTKAEKKTHIIKINHTSFVEIIRQKLR